jgi:hypothetical protein
MDGTDYGALVSDLTHAPPIHKWLPLALAKIICMWGGAKRIDEVLNEWGFKTETSGMKNEDAAFLAALKGR